MNRRLPLLALVAVALALAGFVVVTADREADQEKKPDGSGRTAEPGPTPGAASARGVVLRVLLYTQSGGISAARSYYSSRASSTIGRATLTKALAARRGDLAGQRFKILLADRIDGTVSMVVRSNGPQGDAKLSFALRKKGGRYEVVADSLVGDLVEGLVAQAKRRDGAQPRAARRAGRRVAERYQGQLQ